MEWCLGLEGREPSKLEYEKRQVLQAPLKEQDWCEVAAAALEVVGLRKAVRLGDPRLWRQAVSELDTVPLAPLNLPLPVWDLYQAHPFASVTFRLAGGQEIAVSDWSKFYYCWHSRSFGVREHNAVQFYDATLVVGGVSTRPPAAQTTILERLRWLKAADKPVPFVVRTRNGRAFAVEGPDRFQMDPSASLLVIRFCDEQPLEFVAIGDISAIVLAMSDTRPLLEQLHQRLTASPFVPFHVHLLYGGQYTVHNPQHTLITKKAFILGHGGGSADIHEDAVEVPLTWIDRLETLPS